MANPGRVPREDSGPHAQRLDLDIDDISVDGDGIARIGRLIVHVPFTIPGERVRARVRRGVGAVATATLVFDVELLEIR